MRSLIIAHDLGTTGNKATLYDGEGRLLASCFSAYDTAYPRPGWAEQNPHDWWRAVCESTRGMLAQANVSPADIAVVSFSGQMMGCLPLDRHGEPLRNSIIWADQRSVEQAREIEAALGMEAVYRITGHRISPAYSLTKIMWLRDNEPEAFAQAAVFVHAKDYAVHRLTGALATDYSDASGMNLFDLSKLEWSREILEAARLPKWLLPPLHTSITVIGEVRASAAEETGLRPGTPVVLGGGDGPCAAVGAGVVREGTAYCYLGSSSWIALAADKPIYDPQLRTFNFYHLHPERVMPTGTMQTAGGSHAWVRELFGAEYEALEGEAAATPPGAEGLLFLPYLMGERSPHWDPFARGAFVGLNRRHTRGHLVRAVMEGVALNLRIILDAFRRQGISPPAIRLIGGGAKSRLWRQIMADAWGVPVLLARYLEEGTSLGAAIAGGVGVGIFPSLEVAEEIVQMEEQLDPSGAQSVYEDLYPLFEQSYAALAPVYQRLAPLQGQT